MKNHDINAINDNDAINVVDVIDNVDDNNVIDVIEDIMLINKL